MPIYDYLCRDCGAPYQELILGGEVPTCPQCSSHRAEKQFSPFAARGAGVRPDLPPPGACGTCGDPRGPGSCDN
jgi:putative FmdB family regulatory protein